MDFAFQHDKSLRSQMIKRSGEIFAQVTRHGFGYLLSSTQRRSARFKKLFVKKDSAEKVQLNRYAQIRELLEDLGPTFVKMGQIFSGRADLLPEELMTELQKLQDAVPGFPFERAKQILESELGQPLEKLFLKFNPTPLASASIAQVHEALLPTGQKVAVKILRPDIEQTISIDLEILTKIAPWFEKLLLRSDVLGTRKIIAEFARNIRLEMDFRNEKNNIDKFTANFKDDKSIFVPKVYTPWSSRRVLTMDLVQGIHPLDWPAYTNNNLDRKLIAQRGIDLFLKQIFIHGFFHADPHTGNIFILKDGRICFLDFGMMGSLYGKHKELLAEMLLGLAANDPVKLAKALAALAGKEDLEDDSSLEEDVFLLLEQVNHQALNQINLPEFLNQAINIGIRHKLTLPANLYLLAKSLITIEGFGRRLDPDLDFIERVKPFVKQVLLDKMSPLRGAGAGVESLTGYLNLVRDLPEELRLTFKQLKKGRMKLEILPEDLDKILQKADRISNRLAFALIVTGGLMASALALQTKIPPLWNGIPIVAILGFVGSFGMGFALLISIWRSGRF